MSDWKSRKKKTQLPLAPVSTAVALDYDEHNRGAAPRVSALGDGLLAEEMLRTARRFGIPIKTDSGLTQRLKDVPVETEIPRELYADVAELFVSLNIREKDKSQR